MAEEFQASLLGAKIVTSPKLLISSKTWPPISIITSRNLRKAPFSFSYIKETKVICFKIFYSLYNINSSQLNSRARCMEIYINI